MNQTVYVLHYVSADFPGFEGTWSVYRESYVNREAEEPIAGTQQWVSRHATEQEAETEANRLQKEVAMTENNTRMPDQTAEDLAHTVDSVLGPQFTATDVARALRESGRPVSDTMVLRAYEALERLRGTGYSGLGELMSDPDVTSVHVTGTDVYVNGDRSTSERTGMNDGQMRRLAKRLVALVARRLDETDPFADVRLPDGVRMRVYLGHHGLPFTMRLDKGYPYTLEERVELGLLKRSAAEFLEGEES